MIVNSNESDLSNCIGLKAVDYVQRLVLSFSDIASVTLASYTHLPMIQSRIKPSEAEANLIRNSIELRNKLRLPFWDCVMLSISKTEEPMESLLDTAATHTTLQNSYVSIERQEILNGGIQDFVQDRSTNFAETCIVSKVTMNDGSLRHLPMMDFHCEPTSAGRLAATAVCKKILPNGAVLLESGESFHAYGLELLSEHQFINFLGRSLLYTPIIDRAYVAHQLIEGCCALRISAVSKPNPITIKYFV